MYVTYLTIYSGIKLPPYYIGSTSLKNVGNKYYGSVTSKKYKKIFKKELLENPELFEMVVLSKHETRKEALEVELYLQKKFNVVKSHMFFNESYASVNGMFGRDVSGANNPMFGKTQTEQTKALLREKRGNEKRYNLNEDHKKIISLTHKGKTVTEETKLLISKNRTGKNCGVNHPMFGKTQTEEVKKKISDKNTGKIRSEETKEKISKSTKGKIFNEETRKKISDSKKGKKRKEFSIEWRENLSKSKKNRVISEETKKKLSQPRKSTKSVCPHCKIEGGGGNMKRYHFDNCKLKNKQ